MPRYMENTNEISSHPQAVNAAPGSCFRKVVFVLCLRFGRNLYTMSQNTVRITSVTRVRIRIMKSTTLLRKGICSYTIALMLFPKTEMTRDRMIAIRNSSV